MPAANKIAAIDAFTAAGFQRIEATSYSRADRMAAFRDAVDVLAGIRRRPGVFYKAACPNVQAMERALTHLEAGRGANELALNVSATEGHSQRNLGTTRRGQWETVAAMVRAARGRFRLVGAISCAFGCPHEGRVDPARVIEDVARFSTLGVELVSLDDTAGLATPAGVKALFGRVALQLPRVTAIAHFHNTRGTALVNCMAALEAGCRDFDSAMGGVGAPARVEGGDGLTSNVATEDLANLLEALHVPTGLDLDRVLAASRLCERILGRQLHSMVARSGLGVRTQWSGQGSVISHQ